MNFTRLVLLSLASSLLSAPPARAADCLKDGATVKLTGVVSRETFPGPPNYTSIDDGDKPETVWILTVAIPHCVTAESMEGGKTYEVAKTATRFQLVFKNASDYTKYKSALESKAGVTGQLFVGMTTCRGRCAKPTSG